MLFLGRKKWNFNIWRGILINPSFPGAGKSRLTGNLYFYVEQDR